MNKIRQMIKQSQQMKAEMNQLKKSAKVKRYLELEETRKALHQRIGDHIRQYNVNTEVYRDDGLVSQNKTWVKVSELADFAEAQEPTLKKRLLSLIHSKVAYYTREV